MDGLPLSVLLILFAVAAAVVWAAGTRLPRHAAAIAEKTGIGQAFAGFLILGGVTSMPELSTTISAAAIGASGLALNNILGSVAFNLVLLAAADAVLGRRALTSVVARPATLMQGVLGMLLLALVAAGIAAGDVSFGPVGIWSALLFCACATGISIAYRYEHRPRWVAVAVTEEPEPEPEEPPQDVAAGLAWRTIFLAVLIFSAGTLLALAADGISERTQLGGSLTGMSFLAISTSLPELSAIWGALCLRRYELAIGEVFGSNLFNLSIIFLIDIISPAGPVLDMAGAFEILAALLGLGLTGVFIIGLLERQDRTVFRMGYDSLAALGLYGVGLTFLARFSAG